MKSVKVTDAHPYTRKKFQATLSDWDIGVPIGLGDTIQEALEEFLELWEMHFDQELTKYKWS